MASPLVKLSFDCSSKVALLTLNKPASLNALSVEMGKQFQQVLRHQLPPTTRCIVLTGQGRAFSAGGDLSFLYERTQDTPSNNARQLRAFYELFLGGIRSARAPIVSAINGTAVGAGLSMSLATDIRVVLASAKLSFNFAGLGIHPGMGTTHYLPRLCTPSISADLLLTGRFFSGTEAAAFGLANTAHEEPDAVVDASMEIAKSIAANPFNSVSAIKATLRTTLDDGIEAALWREADSQANHFADEDTQVIITKLYAKMSGSDAQ